ncbi:hypothetical protein, partial [Profundibacterium mesophilum]
MRETVEGKYMTLNLYNGDNWEDNGGTGALLNWEDNGGTGALLTYSDDYVAFVLQGVPTRWQKVFDEAAAARDRINAQRGPGGVQVELAGYEQNHTTPKLPSSGDSEAAIAEQERTWAAKGVQHAIVDQFCAYAANGGKLQNFFVFGAGTTWNSHGAPGRGGVRASFQWLGLINREVMQDVDATRALKVAKADILSDG